MYVYTRTYMHSVPISLCLDHYTQHACMQAYIRITLVRPCSPPQQLVAHWSTPLALATDNTWCGTKDIYWQNNCIAQTHAHPIQLH